MHKTLFRHIQQVFVVISLSLLFTACDSSTTESQQQRETSDTAVAKTKNSDIQITQSDMEKRTQAIRLLRQASFTSKEADITYIMEHGRDKWVEEQFKKVGDFNNTEDDKYTYLETMMRFLHTANPQRYPESIITDAENSLEEYPDPDRFNILSNSIWWEKALENEDQLRQRVAYALSQLLVISIDSPAGAVLKLRAEALAYYYDFLVKHAFGNYKDLLKDITMSPAMCYYLTFIGSSKENNETGTAPDENYARELMQLFTIGLYELKNNGTKKLDANGNPIPTYTQNDVSELSKVFTGWDWQSRKVKGDKGFSKTRYGGTSAYAHTLIKPIEFNADYHDFGSKTFLGKTIPANLSAETEIDKVIEILMNNKNIGPHVSRHLIMRLVTSNPTPGYIKRVTKVFNDNGEGVKGDLKATIRAILTDSEATRDNTPNHFGKVEEYTVALTHFFSTFNVKPLPHFTFTGKVDKETEAIPRKIENTYWFSPASQFYPQLPLTADSVFNFYSPEFVPSDTYMAANNLVAPEMEIRTNNSLIGFSNLFYTLFNYEKYRMLNLGLYNPSKATTMEAWTENADPKHTGFKNIYIDLTDVYEYFEMQLDQDTNGDFANLNSTERGKRKETGTQGEAAIDKLIDYLSIRMLGHPLPQDYKNELQAHLKLITGAKQKIKAEKIIRTAIRGIVTSPLYMVTK
ncbi:MAG: DUF1800 domain-containing protein [Epsilonproteobacteria bacterium]|nr:DUF1800 domain-containing protein [Campylobacterota bacterium]